MLPILLFIAAVSCYGLALHAALYGHYGYALGLFSGGCAYSDVARNLRCSSGKTALEK